MISRSSISFIIFRQWAFHRFGLNLSDEVGATEVLEQLGQWFGQRCKVSGGLFYVSRRVALGAV